MKPIIVITRIEVKPGMMDAFVAYQKDYVAGLLKTSSGLGASRIFRNVDGTAAVQMSQFSSHAAQEDLAKDPGFKDHLAGLEPLVQSASSDTYEEVE